MPDPPQIAGMELPGPVPRGARDPDGAQAIRVQLVGGEEHDPTRASSQPGLPWDSGDQLDAVALCQHVLGSSWS